MEVNLKMFLVYLLKILFLFNGNINATGGVSLDYRIAKKISIQLNVSPVVLVYGVRFIL